MCIFNFVAINNVENDEKQDFLKTTYEYDCYSFLVRLTNFVYKQSDCASY